VALNRSLIFTPALDSLYALFVETRRH